MTTIRGGRPRISPVTRAPASSAVDTSFLARNNPRFEELVQKTPGLLPFLARNTVSTGPRGEDVVTPVEWAWWNHSAATGQKYGHGLTDEQIKADTLVVFQPTTRENARVEFAGDVYPGHEIVAVYNVGDQVTGTSYIDGGFLGRMI